MKALLVEDVQGYHSLHQCQTFCRIHLAQSFHHFWSRYQYLVTLIHMPSQMIIFQLQGIILLN